jgi:hypothetical protein
VSLQSSALGSRRQVWVQCLHGPHMPMCACARVQIYSLCYTKLWRYCTYCLVVWFFPPLDFFLFLWYWGLNSGPSPWAIPPALFLWRFFKIGSLELFSQAGFEPQSSCSLTPE